ALASSDTSAASVPASVTIPAGLTSASFPITFPDNVLAEGNKTAQISASVAGWTGASASLTVRDEEANALHLSFTPSAGPFTFAEGVAPGPATVSLSAPLRTDIQVFLTPSGSSRLHML